VVLDTVTGVCDAMAKGLLAAAWESRTVQDHGWIRGRSYRKGRSEAVTASATGVGAIGLGQVETAGKWMEVYFIVALFDPC